VNSEKLFRVLSYAAVFFGFFALWISGVFGLLGTGLFLAAMIGGWFLEDTRWQISERVGTVLIVLSLPLYYAFWRGGVFQPVGGDSVLPGILARLIVSLSAIKLLQRKSDRDWIFFYVMSFFQVLLAAGLSISALYLASFITYIFVMACTVILFEIRKTRRSIETKVTHMEPDEDARAFDVKRVPITAVVLLVFIVAVATPMFFLLPRVGGAGLGGSGMGGGVTTSSGFSDTVRLGGIGRIQENDEIVMRARIEGRDRNDIEDIRWRGLALDTFDNQSWRKSTPGFPDKRTKGEFELIQVDKAASREGLVVQTIYLEPLDSPLLFVLPRAVGIQGSMQVVGRDPGGSISHAFRGDRVSYKVLSDISQPDVSALQLDRSAYPASVANYLQLPSEMDPRVAELAFAVTRDSTNRYDAARAVEGYLQTEFGYTLEQKAGGDQPLADFLFNVREGHCEYFSTAMAVMLRTQGIATRVVNGFQRGQYNDTADVFVVRQREAHSWVEVYFPGEDAWVTFDPTPSAGRDLAADSGGITAKFNNYLVALETFWIQYFVAFDSSEQRSLFTSVRRGVAEYGEQTTSFLETAQERMVNWWRDVRGDKGFNVSVGAIAYGAVYLAAGVIALLVFVWLCRRIVRLQVWQRLRDRLFGNRGASIVEFYDRMLTVLASKGFTREPHQTPLEFASAVGFLEAISITEKYNRVRFGEKNLSDEETDEIAKQLSQLKDRSTDATKEAK
jgi:transglutaminase-like putative cysteine protease